MIKKKVLAIIALICTMSVAVSVKAMSYRGDNNKVNLTKKISKTYTYAKIRLETPSGVYVLYADE